MRTSVYFAGLILLTSVLTLGCAQQTDVVRLQANSAADAGAYSHFFVFHISNDSNQRQLFEDEIGGQFRRQQVDSVAGYNKLKITNGADTDRIIAVGEAAGADAVLVTRFVEVKAAGELEEGRSEIVSTCRGGDLADYFLYDHEIIVEPVTLNITHTAAVVSSLYDVSTAELVWSIQSTCFNRSSMAEIFADEASTIVQQLSVDGLIAQ